VTRPKAGDIVIVDWRGGALPEGPGRLRPGIVVEDETLFASDFPNILVVPLTSDASIAMPSLSVTIDPAPENGCSQRCFALAPYVTSVSTRRVRATPSRVGPEQLAAIRGRIATAIGAG
jgi:mRNA-degrading endonuclease toxin of MazEF toxin-antitoxin module